jgi:hypothetical protein
MTQTMKWLNPTMKWMNPFVGIEREKNLNIHFETNSNDLCNVCVEHWIHHNSKFSEKTCDCFCEMCLNFEIHIKSANESRNLRIQIIRESY